MIPLATLLFWRKATGLAACIGAHTCHADRLADLKSSYLCVSLDKSCDPHMPFLFRGSGPDFR